MTEPVLIEFVGPPAAGKTTLSQAVATKLRDKKHAVKQPTSNIEQLPTSARVMTKLKRSFSWLITHPRTAQTTFTQIGATNQDATTDFVRVLFNLYYVGGLINRHRSTEGICLLDQGSYQGVWSVGLRADEAWRTVFDRFANYLNQTKPDLVVCVDVASETVADRLSSRSGGDTRLSADSSQFNRAIGGYDHLKTLLASTDCPTITVTNETEEMLESNAIQIVDEIRSLSTYLS